MQKIDLLAVEKIIFEVGAAEIMPRFQKLASGDVEMKGADDPVTVADKEAEWSLTARLTAYLPGSVVIGEESFAKDKSIIQRLNTDDAVWIIDPIDGTRNFVSGKPEFATMVALLHRRKPFAAWICDPNSKDSLKCEQGAGVWLGEERLSLAASDPKLQTVLVMGSRVKKLISDPSVMPNSLNMPPIEVGSCASFDYPRLFTGARNFANAKTRRANSLLYHHTNAWDHVPGMLMHQEVGGYSADWSGNAYNFADSKSGLLYARDRESWFELYDLITPLINYTRKKST